MPAHRRPVSAPPEARAQAICYPERRWRRLVSAALTCGPSRVPPNPPRSSAGHGARRAKVAAEIHPLVPSQPDWTAVDRVDLSSPSLYINRELSWLEFNHRVVCPGPGLVPSAARAGQVPGDLGLQPGRVLHGPGRDHSEEVSRRHRRYLDRRLEHRPGARRHPPAGPRADGPAVVVLVAVAPAAARHRGHPFHRAERLHRRHGPVAEAVFRHSRLSRTRRPSPSTPGTRFPTSPTSA